MRSLLRAIVLSGVPSTAWTVLTRGDVLASTRAAGTLLPGGRPSVARGLVAHVAISTFWWAVLRPLRGRPLAGAVAGLGIAAVDLGVVGRRVPAIQALAQPPQVADHAAFGALAVWP